MNSGLTSHQQRGHTETREAGDRSCDPWIGSLACYPPHYRRSCQWLEHWSHVYNGCLELVLESLGKTTIAADIFMFGIILGDFRFYIDDGMLYVLIRIASMR